MENPYLVSLIIAGYAAIVATGTLIWNILKERRKIRLKFDGYGEFESETDAGELITEYKVEIMIINDSYKPITIKRLGISYGYYLDSYYQLNDVLGKRLKVKQDLSPGDSQIWAIPMKELVGKDGKPAKYVYVEDGTFKRYKTKIPKYVLNDSVLSSPFNSGSQNV
jgi:hypothetical protein